MNRCAKIFCVVFLFVPWSESYTQPITWQRVLDYTNNSSLYKVQQTSDGGYIAVGTNRIGIFSKLFLVKFSEYGDTLWTKIYNLNVNGDYLGFWIEETHDKGFIISGAGAGPQNCYLIKTDSQGNFSWVKTFGGTDIDQGRCVKQLSDNGYILMIRTTSYGNTNDIMLIRTDPLGNEIWRKIYGNDFYEEFGGEIKVLETGFVLAGTKIISNNIGRIFVLRLDFNGDSLWTKTYNKYLTSAANSIDISADGGFVIGGKADSTSNNEPKAYVMKTDSNGKVEWQNRYSTSYNEVCHSIRTVENGYIFCGSSDSSSQGFEKAIFRKINNAGQIIIEKYWIPGIGSNQFYSIEKAHPKGFVICGFAKIGLPRSYIVRTDSSGNIKPLLITNVFEGKDDFNLSQNYPNPFNSQTQIQYNLSSPGYVMLSLYDINGKNISTLERGYKLSGHFVFNFNTQNRNLASGIYFYRLTIIINNSIKYSFCRKLMYYK